MHTESLFTSIKILSHIENSPGIVSKLLIYKHQKWSSNVNAELLIEVLNFDETQIFYY